MSHQTVYTLLTTDSILTGLGMTATTILGSAVQDSPEVRPFAVIKWADETPFIGMMSTEIMQLWVYDEPGSYDLINKVLQRAKVILMLENADVTVGTDHFGTASWNGNSPELYDDIYKCITRYATFTIV